MDKYYAMVSFIKLLIGKVYVCLSVWLLKCNENWSAAGLGQRISLNDYLQLQALGDLMGLADKARDCGFQRVARTRHPRRIRVWVCSLYRATGWCGDDRARRSAMITVTTPCQHIICHWAPLQVGAHYYEMWYYIHFQMTQRSSTNSCSAEWFHECVDCARTDVICASSFNTICSTQFRLNNWKWIFNST